MISVLIWRRKDTRNMCIQQRTMWGHGKKTAVYRPRREATREDKPPTPRLCSSSLRNWKKTNSYCLNHPVCGIFLWQALPTTTPSTQGNLGNTLGSFPTAIIEGGRFKEPITESTTLDLSNRLSTKIRNVWVHFFVVKWGGVRCWHLDGESSDAKRPIMPAPSQLILCTQKR